MTPRKSKAQQDRKRLGELLGGDEEFLKTTVREALEEVFTDVPADSRPRVGDPERNGPILPGRGKPKLTTLVAELGSVVQQVDHRLLDQDRVPSQ